MMPLGFKCVLVLVLFACAKITVIYMGESGIYPKICKVFEFVTEVLSSTEGKTLTVKEQTEFDEFKKSTTQVLSNSFGYFPITSDTLESFKKSNKCKTVLTILSTFSQKLDINT